MKLVGESSKFSIGINFHFTKRRLHANMSLTHYVDSKSVADVRNVMVTIIRDKHPNYKYGLNGEQLRKFFPLVKHYSLKRYPPRMRDNYYLGYCGRHDVNGIRYYYPIVCDKDGLIDHSRCVDCEKPKEQKQ